MIIDATIIEPYYFPAKDNGMFVWFKVKLRLEKNK